jgi:hypothetical protein
MPKSSPTPPTELPSNSTPFNYPSITTAPYRISDEVGLRDLSNFLDNRLNQLVALLIVTSGGGGESFRNYSDDVQDNYLWACHWLAVECRELAEQVWKRGAV